MSDVGSPGSAVDWSEKTIDSGLLSANGSMEISGSGYLVFAAPRFINSNETRISLKINWDGNVADEILIFRLSGSNGVTSLSVFPIRFDEGLQITEDLGNDTIRWGVLLD